ncbi:hypothetical protein BH11BAC1_BH11BAC1_20400 [soil metagenome]
MALSIKKTNIISSIDIALLVGTLLNFINQFQALVSLDPSAISIEKIILTYLVPFIVLVFSSTNFSERGQGKN